MADIRKVPINKININNLRPVAPPKPPMKTRKSLGWVALIIIIVVIVLAGYLLFFKDRGITIGGLTQAGPSDYQAVFLINNQVYFGKLSDVASDFPVLRDIYYLQVEQQLQPVQGEEASQPAQPNVSLVKLGGELHGPVDEMRINREQILLIENLREDSNVVKAILEFKESQKEQQ